MPQPAVWGQILCQWAKALGAFVIGTAGSANKCAIAKAAGADIAINYSQEDWPSALLEATGGKKAAVVYDSVGKATFLKCSRLRRPIRSGRCLRRRIRACSSH